MRRGSLAGCLGSIAAPAFSAFRVAVGMPGTVMQCDQAVISESVPAICSTGSAKVRRWVNSSQLPEGPSGSTGSGSLRACGDIAVLRLRQQPPGGPGGGGGPGPPNEEEMAGTRALRARRKAPAKLPTRPCRRSRSVRSGTGDFEFAASHSNSLTDLADHRRRCPLASEVPQSLPQRQRLSSAVQLAVLM